MSLTLALILTPVLLACIYGATRAGETAWFAALFGTLVLLIPAASVCGCVGIHHPACVVCVSAMLSLTACLIGAKRAKTEARKTK